MSALCVGPPMWDTGKRLSFGSLRPDRAGYRGRRFPHTPRGNRE